VDGQSKGAGAGEVRLNTLRSKPSGLVFAAGSPDRKRRIEQLGAQLDPRTQVMDNVIASGMVRQFLFQHAKTVPAARRIVGDSASSESAEVSQ